MLLGNDLRKMDAATLSIINNPAIIALSQDPRGRAVQLISRNTSVPQDSFGIGEAHVWSGPLANGDQVVIFLNAADADLEMSASLAELFVSDGTHGTAPQVQQSWAVHDLWANRISDNDAQAILDAPSDDVRASLFEKLDLYNATETSYAKGLDADDARLFGKKVGDVEAAGNIEAHVPRHAAKVFRLRSQQKGGKPRKSLVKQEL